MQVDFIVTSVETKTKDENTEFHYAEHVQADTQSVSILVIRATQHLTEAGMAVTLHLMPSSFDRLFLVPPSLSPSFTRVPSVPV